MWLTPVDFWDLTRYTGIRRLSGRSSVWLERYLGVVEAARSSRVAPTKKDKGLLVQSLIFFYYKDDA